MADSARHVAVILADNFEDWFYNLCVFRTQAAERAGYVEDFGTDRVSRLTAPEISERVAELARITHFEDAPIELRT